MVDVNTYVDCREKEFENTRKVIFIQEQFSGKFPWLALPHRRFVEDISVTEVSSSMKPRHFFLFNDILVITREQKENGKYHVISVTHLANMSVSNTPYVDSNSCELVIQFQHENSFKSQKYIIDSPNTIVHWRNEIFMLQKSISASLASITPETAAEVTNVAVRSPKKKPSRKRQHHLRRSLNITKRL